MKVVSLCLVAAKSLESPKDTLCTKRYHQNTNSGNMFKLLTYSVS